MGIGNVRATEGIAGGQTAMARPVDSVSKGIQDEISNVQRQMQELSSKADLSVEEKIKKRQELQQQISSLNTQLRQHQAQMRQEQQKKTASDVRKTDGAGADTEKVGTGMSGAGMQAMVAAGSSLERARQQGTVVRRIEGDIGVLRSEISQDAARGADVKKKEEELAGLEARAQNAAASRSEDIGEAGWTMRTAAKAEREAGDDSKVIVKGDKDGKDRVLIKSTNFSKEKNQGAQQMTASVDIRG